MRGDVQGDNGLPRLAGNLNQRRDAARSWHEPVFGLCSWRMRMRPSSADDDTEGMPVGCYAGRFSQRGHSAWGRDQTRSGVIAEEAINELPLDDQLCPATEPKETDAWWMTA
jgi:hypothetical protein